MLTRYALFENLLRPNDHFHFLQAKQDVMLIESLKNVAKKLPFFDALYLRLKNGKHLRDGKNMFTNPK